MIEKSPRRHKLREIIFENTGMLRVERFLSAQLERGSDLEAPLCHAIERHDGQMLSAAVIRNTGIRGQAQYCSARRLRWRV